MPEMYLMVRHGYLNVSVIASYNLTSLVVDRDGEALYILGAITVFTVLVRVRALAELLVKELAHLGGVATPVGAVHGKLATRAALVDENTHNYKHEKSNVHKNAISVHLKLKHFYIIS